MKIQKNHKILPFVIAVNSLLIFSGCQNSFLADNNEESAKFHNNESISRCVEEYSFVDGDSDDTFLDCGDFGV